MELHRSARRVPSCWRFRRLATSDPMKRTIATWLPTAPATPRGGGEPRVVGAGLRPPDGLPFIERMPRGGVRIVVGTGYAKWGITNAVAAGRAISADILGSPVSWS